MKSIKHEIRVLTRHTGRHKVVENVVLEKETFSFLCGKISFKSFSFFIFSISAHVFLYFCIFVTKSPTTRLNSEMINSKSTINFDHLSFHTKGGGNRPPVTT